MIQSLAAAHLALLHQITLAPKNLVGQAVQVLIVQAALAQGLLQAQEVVLQAIQGQNHVSEDRQTTI